ncbi:MAG: hypothetical protein AAF085_14140 [Planctomycetota bacterium]
MRKIFAILCLSACVLLGGCSARPVSKTVHHVKQGYNTTKQVYHTTKAVVRLVNPLEYIYVAEHGEALTPEGEPFVTEQAILETSHDPAE